MTESVTPVGGIEPTPERKQPSQKHNPAGGVYALGVGCCGRINGTLRLAVEPGKAPDTGRGLTIKPGSIVHVERVEMVGRARWYNVTAEGVNTRGWASPFVLEVAQFVLIHGKRKRLL